MKPGIVNPAGDLTLHLVGNLRYPIGQELDGIPYVWDRAAEFSRRNVTRAELLGTVRTTAATIQTVLAGLDDSRLKGPSPVTFAGFPEDANIEYFLTSL